MDDTLHMISFALKQCRSKFAALAKSHGKDEPAEDVARAILAHIRESGFDVVRVRPIPEAPRTPRST